MNNLAARSSVQPPPLATRPETLARPEVAALRNDVRKGVMGEQVAGFRNTRTPRASSSPLPAELAAVAPATQAQILSRMVGALNFAANMTPHPDAEPHAKWPLVGNTGRPLLRQLRLEGQAQRGRDQIVWPNALYSSRCSTNRCLH